MMRISYKFSPNCKELPNFFFFIFQKCLANIAPLFPLRSMNAFLNDDLVRLHIHSLSKLPVSPSLLDSVSKTRLILFISTLEFTHLAHKQCIALTSRQSRSRGQLYWWNAARGQMTNEATVLAKKRCCKRDWANENHRWKSSGIWHVKNCTLRRGCHHGHDKDFWRRILWSAKIISFSYFSNKNFIRLMITIPEFDKHMLFEHSYLVD